MRLGPEGVPEEGVAGRGAGGCRLAAGGPDGRAGGAGRVGDLFGGAGRLGGGAPRRLSPAPGFLLLLFMESLLWIEMHTGLFRLAHAPSQVCFNEAIQPTLQHRLGIAYLMVGPVILDHLVRMQHVGAYLIAPAGIDVFTF